jgi:hypothetical protein
MKLYDFYRENWKYIDSVPFKSNWHLKALCDRLEDWAGGKIPNLIVAMPPCCGASSLFSVALPVWLWSEFNPSSHVLTASSRRAIAQRDIARSDRLMEILVGQQAEQHRVTRSIFAPAGLIGSREDTNKGTKSLLVNVAGGTRRSSVPESHTKFSPEEKPADFIPADFAIVDHPVSQSRPFGSDKLLEIYEWWNEAIAKPETRWLLVTPRLKEKDLVGFLLDRSDLEFCYIPIPLQYSRWVVVDSNSRPCPEWKDPRKEGEILWMERYPDKETMGLIRRLGGLRASAQLQQHPVS